MERSGLRQVLAEAKTLWYQRFFRRPVLWRADAPVVSITFDDVPYSTYEHGLPVLDRYGVKGTFYVCLGVDTLANKPLLGRREIAELYDHGHEISCHTYSHYALDEGTADGIAADCGKNCQELARLIDGHSPKGFAFPYGLLSLSAKKELAPHYEYLRSTRPGINHGVLDFNCLRATALNPVTKQSAGIINRCLDKLEQRKGWLITYTHGVAPNPTRFDTSPELLDHLLRECRRRGIHVAPVSEVARIALRKAPAIAVA